LIVDDLNNIGPHYSKCLRMWRERFLDTFDELAANSGMMHVYNEEFKRKWEFYFAYCEAGFASRTLGVNQVRITRNSNADLNGLVPL
jgi:cyclopropane-fatty-acyl-phospholipid synthase